VKRKPVHRRWEPHDVLTTEEVAEWMHLHPRTIEKMRLPTIAPGRYLMAHVLEDLDRRRRKGRAA
jgi:hypothetical protein